MLKMRSARRGVADADLTKAGRLFEVDNTQIAPTTQPLAGSRFERLIERVHSLGPRVFAEMLDEIATATGAPGLIADCIEKYAALDPAALRAVGGDRFAPMPLGLVP